MHLHVKSVSFLRMISACSPYAYRWLRAAHNFTAYRENVAGITLQSEGLISAATGASLKKPKNGIGFFYRLMGSWGFSPDARIWRDFQNWYHSAANDSKFQPYVDGLVMTRWYKSFQKKNTADSMWTMWFIYYCNEHKLFTLYNNLQSYTKRDDSCLAVNRREPGLHYKGSATDNLKNCFSAIGLTILPILTNHRSRG